MKRWSLATLWTIVYIVSVLLVFFSPFVLLYDAIVGKGLEYDPNLISHRLVDHSEEVAKLDLIAEELASKYSAALEETKNTVQHRIIVFDCLNPRRCYGLGDRLRGISTVFYLSLLTSSSLFLNVQIPYPLLNFLTPTLYDWRINATVSYEGQVHGKACWWNDSTAAQTPLAKPVGAQLLEQKGTGHETQWWDWLTQWPQRLWRSDIERFDAAQELSSKRVHRFLCNVGYPQAWLTNLHMRPAVLAYGLDKLQPEHLFSVAMRMLFKPSPCIKAEIDKYTGIFPDWDDFRTLKIGVQMRTWVSKDRWMQGIVRPPPWECYKKQLLLLMREEVRRLALSLNKTRSREERRLRSRVIVYLTGDNQDALDHLKATLVAEGIRVFQTDHDPSHLSMTSTMDLAAKSYVDWWLLTKMDRLVITRSTFGETAAAYSLKPAVVIDGWSPDCNTWQFNNTFHMDG